MRSRKAADIAAGGSMGLRTGTAGCDTEVVPTRTDTATRAFVDAIVARDFARARGLLHPAIDFRGMTPKRVWEADGPAGVEEALRAWFENPERDVERVERAEQSGAVADTQRVGWRVHGTGVDGAFVFEQLAYIREHDGRVAWLRVMCSGPRPVPHATS